MDDTITLTLPFKAEYVSVARLTASGIANRMGFDIDTVEDIKVAIAEVCNKLINIGHNKSGEYSINFLIKKASLNITFNCSDAEIQTLYNENDSAFSTQIILALMDNVAMPDAGQTYIISMTKNIEGID